MGPNPHSTCTDFFIAAPACASGFSLIWTLGLSFWWQVTFPVYYHQRAWEIISEKKIETEQKTHFTWKMLFLAPE